MLLILIFLFNPLYWFDVENFHFHKIAESNESKCVLIQKQYMSFGPRIPGQHVSMSALLDLTFWQDLQEN